jgi:hypothetical protein
MTGMIAAPSELIQIALPTDLSSQRKNPFLFLQPDQCPQSFVDDRFLCRQAGEFSRLFNQSFVNHDIGSHRCVFYRYLMCMGKSGVASGSNGE